MVKRQARDLENRRSNPGSGSNFSLEFKILILQGTNYRFVFTCQFELKILFRTVLFSPEIMENKNNTFIVTAIIVTGSMLIVREKAFPARDWF